MIAPNNSPDPGRPLEDPHHTRADLVMLRRAIAKGWPVSDKVREKVMGLVETVLDNPSATVKAKLGAGKLALMADGVNVRREALDQKDEHHEDGQVVHHEHTITLTTDQLRRRALESMGLVGNPGATPGPGNQPNGGGQSHKP